MNLFRRTRFVLAVALLAAVPAAALADVCTCPPERYHPVTLSLFPPISTNGCASGEVKSTFALNIIGGYLGALEGFELGGLFNAERYHATGLQIAGGVNRVGGDFTGLQLAALANWTCGDVYGVQLGALNRAGGDLQVTQLGAVNIAGGSATTQFGVANIAGGRTAFTLGGFNWTCGKAGFQLGGFNWARQGVWAAQVGGFNFTGGRVPFQLGALNGAGGNSGLQLGGFNLGGADNCVEIGGVNILRGVSAFQLGAVNLAGGAQAGDGLGLIRAYYPKLGGVQLGGINAAGGSFGAQVGLVNIASEVRWFQFGAFNFARESEVPIGPLNVILNGQFRVAAFASEAGLAHLELKTGGRHFYNVLSFGYLPTDSARVLFGYGVGVHFPCCCERLFVDADLVGFRVNPMADMMSFDGTSYLAKLRATGGWQVAPPFALIGGLAVNAWLSDSETGADIPFLPIPMLTLDGDTNISIWPGFLFGIEWRAW